MSPTLRRPPSYRLHKPTGQAVVTLNGKDFYLGAHDTPASREAYDRKIAEWLASGRQITPKSTAARPVTVTKVIAAFWQHAEAHYVKRDGTPTSELAVYRYVLRLPETLCGSTPAVEFGPLALKAVREAMLGRGYKRTSINKHVHRIRRVFEWAAAQEPPAPLPPIFSDRAVSTAARVSGSFCMCQ